MNTNDKAITKKAALHAISWYVLTTALMLGWDAFKGRLDTITVLSTVGSFAVGAMIFYFWQKKYLMARAVKS